MNIGRCTLGYKTVNQFKQLTGLTLNNYFFSAVYLSLNFLSSCL